MDDGAETAAMLMQLDLATEVMEGLDELGVETKEQLQELMSSLEQRIAEED